MHILIHVPRGIPVDYKCYHRSGLRRVGRESISRDREKKKKIRIKKKEDEEEELPP